MTPEQRATKSVDYLLRVDALGSHDYRPEIEAEIVRTIKESNRKIITAFLENAAKDGFHLRPDEATEAMAEAGMIASRPYRDMTTGGPEDAYQLVWRAMGRVAPVYEDG